MRKPAFHGRIWYCTIQLLQKPSLNGFVIKPTNIFITLESFRKTTKISVTIANYEHNRKDYVCCAKRSLYWHSTFDQQSDIISRPADHDETQHFSLQFKWLIHA